MIESKRLYLRRFKPSDYKLLFDLDSNLIVHKHLYNTPMKTISEAKKYISELLNQYDKYTVGRLIVFDKKDNFIGWSGLKYNTSTINNKSNFYDIGYRLRPEYWGKGLATESSLAILDYYKNNKNIINNIYAIVSTDNIASNQVLLKSGLKFITEFSLAGKSVNWYEL
ncbi:MAG: GNAT family N-acetyltransferase [Flavobacteriales bacterium]|jgi:ribosomal-protein-alanine N-acetyltransferase|tara:strand:- start:295 stop:798 length:504 start_codon:yes stop_codon:yes gene_type:complete